MRRHIRLSAGILFVLIVFTGCSADKSHTGMTDDDKAAIRVDGEDSLSESDRLKQKKARKEILDSRQTSVESEKTLSDVMRDAEQYLSEAHLSQLRQAQESWLRSGRGSDMNALRKSGLTVAEAYARANVRRADFIRNRVSQIMLMETPGKFGGFYKTSDGRELELYEMPGSRLNMVLRSADGDFTYTASGSAEETGARLCSEVRSDACVRLERQNQDIITVAPDESFEQKADGVILSIVSGRFGRMHIEGVQNVFAP